MNNNKTNAADKDLTIPMDSGMDKLPEAAGDESGLRNEPVTEPAASSVPGEVSEYSNSGTEGPEDNSSVAEGPDNDPSIAESPESSPSEAAEPESSPSEAETPGSDPSEADAAENSPARVAAPETSPSEADTTEISPAEEAAAPEISPSEADTTEISPAEETAAQENTPVEAPAQENSSETSPAETAAPETSPAEAPVPESTPSETPPPGFIPPAGEDPEKKKKKKKKRRSLLAFWLAFLILAGALGGIYYYGYQYCQTHFMPGTTINGYDCSDMTAEEAQRWFDIAAQNYVMNIRFRGGTTETLSAEDMGFSYKPDGSIDVLLQNQDETLWPKYYLEESHYTITPTGTYDPDILEASLKALPELQKENMDKPEDAYIHFRKGTEDTDGAFEIVPDVKGSTIDLDQLAAGVGDAAARYEEMVDAEEIAFAYKTADVQADDAKLAAKCMDLNDLVGASLTYVMPDNEKVRLNSDVLKEWLVQDKKGELVKNDEIWNEKLGEFIQTLAEKGNTVGMNRHFNATLQGPIVVSGGFYGYAVDKEAERMRLVKDLENCTKETRKPIYWVLPYNEETEYDGIGTTYIEADLSAQHVWCYVNGRLVMDCDCVSGTMSDGHATQAGVYGIMFMKRDAMLKGLLPNSSSEYEYETEVKYWMPFYTDVGFHDAWWRTSFGGDIYLRDGSHGCINLPPEAAKELFSYCDENMPVVVYY